MIRGYGRAPRARVVSICSVSAAIFDLLWRFELFGGIPCFLRSQVSFSSKCRRLIWPKAIRLNGNVPIAVMPNGLGDARTVSRPSSPSMSAIQAFEDLVIVSVLFVIVNSLGVALRTKLLCDEQRHAARRSRGGKSIKW